MAANTDTTTTALHRPHSKPKKLITAVVFQKMYALATLDHKNSTRRVFVVFAVTRFCICYGNPTSCRQYCRAGLAIGLRLGTVSGLQLVLWQVSESTGLQNDSAESSAEERGHAQNGEEILGAHDDPLTLNDDLWSARQAREGRSGQGGGKHQDSAPWRDNPATRLSRRLGPWLCVRGSHLVCLCTRWKHDSQMGEKAL